MATTAFPLAFRHHESLRGSLVASVLFHLGLGLAMVLYTVVGFRHNLGWGSKWAKGSAIHVNMVSTLPGIPLPRPRLQTPNTVHTENPGLYEAQPEPLVAPPPNAVKLPRFKNLQKLTPPVRTKTPEKVVLPPERRLLVNKRIQKQTMTPPPNAIPTGANGNPAMNFGQIVNSTGQGVLLFKGGNFGELYGWYVEAVKNRISSNWLLSIINPQILSARRVYVEFDILRNGTIADVKLTQSSGIPEVDRSALRAVYASSPLAPLPAGYKGNNIHVDFYFDFHR
ncbi:MAG: energy transducer TonB [Terriglobia bacterium]